MIWMANICEAAKKEAQQQRRVAHDERMGRSEALGFGTDQDLKEIRRDHRQSGVAASVGSAWLHRDNRCDGVSDEGCESDKDGKCSG